MSILGPILSTTDYVSRIESFSGMECYLRMYLKKRLEDFDYNPFIDGMGNLWALSDGIGGNVLLCAHMDKVGFGHGVSVEDGNIVGRLDDALGIGLIITLIESGLHPSVLFTVEEESWVEDGKTGWYRNLPGGIHSAGARYAVEQMWQERIKKPRLIIVVDVSQSLKPGEGTFIYKSSFKFACPVGTLNDAEKILKENHIDTPFIHGGGTDLIEFTFFAAEGVGCIGIGIPILNMHSSNEKADVDDVIRAFNILNILVGNVDAFVSKVEQAPKIS